MVYYWQFSLITAVEQILGFFARQKLWTTFDKNGLGYILGDFFHNVVGHPRGNLSTIYKGRAELLP
jgi:hypothetical protein